MQSKLEVVETEYSCNIITGNSLCVEPILSIKLSSHTWYKPIFYGVDSLAIYLLNLLHMDSNKRKYITKTGIILKSANLG